MTTVFAFKAKNAWILVSDTLSSTPIFIDNSREDYQMVDLEEKFRFSNNLVISGAGDPHDIMDIWDSLSEFTTIDECKGRLKTYLQNKDLNGKKNNPPKIIIISIKEQEAVVIECVKLQKIPNIQIPFIQSHEIIGTAEDSREQADVKSEMLKYSDHKISDDEPQIKEIAVAGAKMLGTLWKGIVKGENLKTTGHPAISGCKVCIIWPDKFKIVSVHPRHYFAKVEK